MPYFAKLLLPLANCLYFTNYSVYLFVPLAGNSCVAGVSHALHSPLMAMTNAISGMTIVGGMLQLGGGLLPGTVPQVLAAAAGTTCKHAHAHIHTHPFTHMNISMDKTGV